MALASIFLNISKGKKLRVYYPYQLMKKLPLFLMFLMISMAAYPQVFSKITGKRNRAYRDSLKTVQYNYVLPIWGEKVREGGYDLPNPAGAMLGFYWQKQNLTISNLSIGLGDGDELENIDDWTEFEYIKTENMVYTFRPDVWLFPFLNLYATASKFSAATNAQLSQPFDLSIPTVNKSGYGGGFGSVLVYGFGPLWVSGNFNMNWSRAPGVDKPTQSIVSSLRLGTQVHSRNRKHYGTIWLGANYQNYLGSNTGTYDMTELLPDEKPKLEELKEKVEAKIEDIQNGLDDFCSKPGNRPACLVIDQVLNELKDRIEDKIDGINPPDELLLRHGYNVEPEQKWNMIIGAQYNFNARWEARFEVGFIGRQSFLMNVNYRFGFIQKKDQRI